MNLKREFFFLSKLKLKPLEHFICSNSHKEISSTDSTEVVMENDESQKEASLLLLELSAINDIDGFKHAIEESGLNIDSVGSWYGKRIGSKKMGFEERTPLMIAAIIGSVDILKFILQTGRVDVNRASGSDGSTALHCAAAGGSPYSHEVIKLLIDSNADVTQVDSNGNRPVDVISNSFSFSSKLKRKTLDSLLNKGDTNDNDTEDNLSPKYGSNKKEYPVDPSLPDIKTGIYGTDEFRMYTFKVKPCSRAYSHDWTECPFVHPGENARRRDPHKYHYSCVPCPEFRQGACLKGDACEYAHGIFECWLHPAQYRTRLCKDETNCARRVCFFAHKTGELRPLYASTGSAVPSPTGGPTSWHSHFNVSPPPAPQLPGSRLKAVRTARDMMNVEAMGSPTGWSNSGNWSNELGWIGGPGPDPSFLAQSPKGLQMRRNINYSSGMPSSPVRAGSPFSMDSCGSPGSNPRLTSFANRSQSFIERSIGRAPTHLSDWGSSDGKVEWGVQPDQLNLNQFRKSASFGLGTSTEEVEPDVSWVQSLVKDGSNPSFEEEVKYEYNLNSGGSDMIPSWVVDQFYIEQEPMMA